MKAPLRFFSVVVATCFVLLCASRAQLQTYQTLLPHPPGYSNNSDGFGNSVTAFHGTNGAVQGEVFTNVLAIDKMTYNLFTAGNAMTSQLKAEFGEWSPDTSSFVGSTIKFTTATTPSLSVPAIGLWPSLDIGGDMFKTYQISFDITSANGGLLYTTDPTKNYALLITQVTGFNNFTSGNIKYGIGQTGSEADFAYGYGIVGNSTGHFFTTNYDFTFSQIVVTPNPTVPESATIAAFLGAALVAGLVALRLRQRRQVGLSPVRA